MFSLGGCTKSPSPEAKEAVVALKKLQARTQVGISYHDYSALLGERLDQSNYSPKAMMQKVSPS